MNSISFSYNETPFRLRQSRFIKQWIGKVAALHKREIEAVGVVFCTDDFLLGLNQQFLSHDYYTDIITFDYCEGKRLTGEIYISIDRVRDNARQLGVPVTEELHRVLAHGFLHLIGFTDTTDASRNRMRKEEDRALSLRAL